MPSPTYQQAFTPSARRRCYWSVEATAAGTAPALTSATWHSEGVIDFNPSPQRSRYTGQEYVGVPVMSLTNIEINHHSQFSISVPYRAGGLADYAFALLMGDQTNTGTAETVTGTVDPFTHAITPGLKSTREATFAFILDTGTSSGNDGLLYTYCTLTSFHLTMDPSSVVMVELQFTGRWHTVTTMPTVPTVSPATRIKSTQATLSIHSNAGAIYTAKPLSGDLTITRQGPEVLFSIANASKDPLDILPGAFDVMLNVDFIYDSVQSGTPYGDFLTDLAVGATTGNANSLAFVDDNSHGPTITFWPAKWETLNIVATSGQSTHLNGTLHAFQDEASATQASPILTVIKSLSLINGVSGNITV